MPTRSAGGDHFLAFTTIAWTLICCRRRAKWSPNRPQLLILGRHDPTGRLRPIGRTVWLCPGPARELAERLSPAGSGRLQTVAAAPAGISGAGTDRWADLLMATMPEGLVRDAILASPAWPDMAAMMPRLDQLGPAAGVPVAAGTAANPYTAPAGTEATPTPAAPDRAPAAEPVAVSADARAMWGPLTEGLTVSDDLDLSERPAALE
ncbi:hypothetical protein ACIGD1_26025 [Streptomyces sp. NPDC085612]|uniref:hypothetical protein n=1 Tax=Streptomyces sp. NPDC085612 TaxID=3365732 RepID=UPI0037D52D46